MLKRQNLVVGVLVVALGLPLLAQEKSKEAGAVTGDKAVLIWKFEKDKAFYQELTTNTNQTMKVMGQDVKQVQKQTFYFSWTPSALSPEGIWTIKQKIEGVKMDITINDQQITYDSTAVNPPNNPLADFFKALVGAEFTLSVDKAMKVTKVEGREQFIAKLGSANAQMEPLLKKILSDEALKQMADPTFGVVPNKEVTKGEKWKKTSSLDLGPIGSYTNEYDYTSEGKENDLQKISVKTTLTYAAPKDSDTGLPFKIKSADLKSKDGGGTIYFNQAKGRVEKSTLTLKLNGSLDIDIGGTTTKVELNQDQTTTSTTSDTSLIKPAAK